MKSLLGSSMLAPYARVTCQSILSFCTQVTVVGLCLRKTTKAQSTTEEMTKTRIETLSRDTPSLQAKVVATQGEGMSVQDSKDR